jgi:hypothetical protein
LETSGSARDAPGTNRKEFTMGFRRRARRRGLIAGAAIGAAASRRGNENDAPPEEYEAAPPPAPESDTDQLQQLAQLHASGALTDEEFAAAKAKILGA